MFYYKKNNFHKSTTYLCHEEHMIAEDWAPESWRGHTSAHPVTPRDTLQFTAIQVISNYSAVYTLNFFKVEFKPLHDYVRG